MFSEIQNASRTFLEFLNGQFSEFCILSLHNSQIADWINSSASQQLSFSANTSKMIYLSYGL